MRGREELTKDTRRCWSHLVAASCAAVLVDYTRTGLVPKFPSLIASGMFPTVAMLLWMTGLMLDTINQKHRQLFELFLTASRNDVLGKSGEQ